MVKKHIFLSLIFLLVYKFSFAQQVRVFGTVFNEYKQPLTGVTISQIDIQNKVNTNDKGTYSLPVFITPSVKICFSAIGYSSREIVINNLTKNYELNIVLKDSVQNLAPIIVDANKKQITTLEQLNTSGSKFLPSSSGGNIETMIATLAGVSSTSELSSQYSVRGGNFDENLVYVNGIEIYRPLLVRNGQQEGLSFINPDMVSNVGFSSGGYGAEYGDKYSSVLDIQYKKPKSFEAAMEASLLGGSLYAGTSTRRFSQITGLRYKTNRSLLKKSDMKAEFAPSFTDAQTYLTYKLASEWEMSFLVNYAYNSYKFTPKTRETKFGTLDRPKTYKVYFNGWERDKYVNYHAAFTLKGKITERFNIGFTGATFSSDERERYDIEGSYRLTDLDEENGGLMTGVGSYMEHARNKLEADIYSFTHFANFNLNKHQIKWGITYQKEEIKDKIKEWEMRDSAGYNLPNNEYISVFSNLKSDNKLNSSRYSGYAQDKFIFESSQGAFIINAGIRFSYWDFNKELLISPRGSIAFVPSNNDNLTFRFATGIYHQAPFYKEIQKIESTGGNNSTILNSNIKSPKAIHFVLGGDYYFKTNNLPFKLTSEIYYKRLSDVIPYTVNNVKIRYSGENLAKGYMVGFDMKLYGEFIPGTDSWISFSLMKTEQDIQGKKTPLPTDQRYNLSVYFQDYMPGYERFRMSVLGFFSQGVPVTAPYKGLEDGYFRSSAYKRVDIGLSWLALGENFAIRNQSAFFGAFRNIWLGLDIFNLFDMKNVNTYYWISDAYNYQYAVPNYMTGRQFNIKLRAEF